MLLVIKQESYTNLPYVFRIWIEFNLVQKWCKWQTNVKDFLNWLFIPLLLQYIDSNQVIPNITRRKRCCNDLLSNGNKVVLITIHFVQFFLSYGHFWIDIPWMDFVLIMFKNRHFSEQWVKPTSFMSFSHTAHFSAILSKILLSNL